MLKTNKLDDLNMLETRSFIPPTDTINDHRPGPSHDSDPNPMPSLLIRTTEKPANNAVGLELYTDTISEHSMNQHQYEGCTHTDNEIVVLDDNGSDLIPSLYMETTEKPTNNAVGSQSNADGINNSSRNTINGNPSSNSIAEMGSKTDKPTEKSMIELLDGTDSDYSVTSLFGEAMQDISQIDTESAQHTKSPTEDNGRFHACEETQSVVERSVVESNAMLPDGSDSDDSVVSLYREVMGNKLSKASKACQKVGKVLQFKEKQLCFICGILQRDLNHHMKIRHIKNMKFACPHCPKTFVRRFEMIKHINTWHEKNIIISCAHCGKGFTNRNSHHYHLVNSHRMRALHECKICQRKLKSWDGYKKHLKTHSLTSHPCPDCDKLFKTTDTLEKHKIRYHSS